MDLLGTTTLLFWNRATRRNSFFFSCLGAKPAKPPVMWGGGGEANSRCRTGLKMDIPARDEERRRFRFQPWRAHITRRSRWRRRSEIGFAGTPLGCARALVRCVADKGAPRARTPPNRPVGWLASSVSGLNLTGRLAGGRTAGQCPIQAIRTAFFAAAAGGVVK